MYEFRALHDHLFGCTHPTHNGAMTMAEYAECPKCGESNAKPVSFTWWGGLIGPKLLTHVKCEDCGATYNGKTGQSNTRAIVIYMVVGVIVGAILLVALNHLL
jgi:uncharacterized protein (DUF983 family)